jgi:hypothetical protein
MGAADSSDGQGRSKQDCRNRSSNNNSLGTLQTYTMLLMGGQNMWKYVKVLDICDLKLESHTRCMLAGPIIKPYTSAALYI